MFKTVIVLAPFFNNRNKSDNADYASSFKATILLTIPHMDFEIYF